MRWMRVALWHKDSQTTEANAQWNKEFGQWHCDSAIFATFGAFEIART